jgi:hypothetical protein
MEVKKGGTDVLPFGLRPVEERLEVAGAELGREREK